MTKLNFVTPTLVLIILALLFYLFNLRSQSKIDRLESEAESREHLEKVKALQNEAAQFKAQADAEKRAREISRDSARTQQRANEVALSANLATISALKKKLAPKLAENPDVDTLVQAQERAYNKLDSLYKGAGLQHAAEIVSYEKELKDRGRELLLKEAEIAEKDARISELQGDNRKLGRKVTFWKIVGGVAVATTVYISLKSAD